MWTKEGLAVPDLSAVDTIAIDTEEEDRGLQSGLGSGWWNKNGKVVGISLSFSSINTESSYHRYYFPLHHPGWNIPDEMKDELRKQLQNFKGTIAMHNAVFDIGWLETEGFTFNKEARIVDTGYAAALLDENRTSYSLDVLGLEDIGVGKDYSHLQEKMKELGIRTMHEMMSKLYLLPAEDVGEYAEQDAEVTLRLWMLYRKELEKNKLTQLFNLECRGIPLLIAMRKQGVPIDVERVHELIEVFKEKEVGIQKELDDMAGEAFPVTRTKKHVEIVVRMVGEDKLTKSEKGNWQLGKKHLGNINNPFLIKMRELNSVRKLRKDFLENFLKFQVNGRIHAEFHPLRTNRENESSLISTRTGRYSSTCIAKGTLIALWGEDVPIEKVQPNDLIYCFTDDNKLKVSHVIAKKKMGVRECLTLFWRDPFDKNNRGQLVCTPDHKINTALGWEEAGSIKPGTLVRTFPDCRRDDRYLVITDIEPAGQRAVYDLEIYKYPNFIAGELSVHNCPNLTNIPADGELGQMIRSCFIPDEGCDWFCADYSQQEYRWAAHFAIREKCRGSDIVKKMYEEDPNLDFHNMGSQLLFGNVDPHNRKKVKTLGFGILYGQGLKGFAQSLGCDKDEAAELLAEYRHKVPFVTAIMEKAKAFVESRGYVRTWLGRIRHYDFFEPNTYDPKEREELGIVKGMALAMKKTLTEDDPWYGRAIKRCKTYSAINSLCQGSSADQTKLAAITMFEKYGIVPYIIVHDEFNVPVPKGDTELGKKVVEVMETVMKLEVPVKAEGGTGNNWAEAKH